MKRIKNILFIFLIFFLVSCGKESLQNSVNLKSTYDFLNTKSIEMNIHDFFIENQIDMSIHKSKGLRKIQEELLTVSYKTYFNTFSELNLIKDFDSWIDYSSNSQKPYLNLKQLINNKNLFQFTNYQHGLNNIFLPEIFDFLKITKNQTIGSNYEAVRKNKEFKETYSNYYEINPSDFYCITEEQTESLLTNQMSTKKSLYGFIKREIEKTQEILGFKIVKINDEMNLEYFLTGNNVRGYIEYDLFPAVSEENSINYYRNSELLMKIDFCEIPHFYTSFSLFKNLKGQTLNPKLFRVEKKYSDNPHLTGEYIENLRVSKPSNYAEVFLDDITIKRLNDRFFYQKDSLEGGTIIDEKLWSDEDPMIQFTLYGAEGKEKTPLEQFLKCLEILQFEVISPDIPIKDFFQLPADFVEEESIVQLQLKKFFNETESQNRDEILAFILNHYLKIQFTDDAYVSAIHNLKSYRLHSDYYSDFSQEMITLMNPVLSLAVNAKINYQFDLKDLKLIDHKNARKYYFLIDLYSFKDKNDLPFFQSDLFSADETKKSFSITWQELQDRLKELNLAKGDYLFKIKLMDEFNTVSFSQQSILSEFVNFGTNLNFSFVAVKGDKYSEFQLVNPNKSDFKDAFYIKVR